MKTLQIIVVVMLLCSIAVAADSPTTAPAPKSADAIAAMTAYNTAEAKAKADYDKAVGTAKAELIKALEVAQGKATKAGNLNEAIAIREQIKSLQSEGKVATTAPETKPLPKLVLKGKLLVPAKTLIGMWTDDSRQQTVSIADDGTLIYGHNEKGTWKASATFVIIIMGETSRIFDKFDGASLTNGRTGDRLVRLPE